MALCADQNGRSADAVNGETKRCARCTETKPVAEFSTRRNGYQPYCRPCASLNLKDWMAKTGKRDMHYAAVKASKARYPERLAARRAVQAALSSGRLVRQPCEVATDCAGQIQAHHDDYSKPLEVRWLCKRHHAAWHSAHKVAA